MNVRRLVLALLLLGTGAASAQMSSFVLPWDDASTGPTDASRLNRSIGEDSRVTVDAAGHFQAMGQRIRFLGMNLAGDTPFMPTNKAAAVAGRLAKFGINAVRFHHIDAPWATGGGILRYTSTSSRTVNESQLQRIHFLVSQLRSRGIYSDVNLLTGREYRSGDGLGAEVTQLDSKLQHVLACFHPTALDLQKEFATRLLTPTNRFTGQSLAQDPSVAFVEILNENGLLQKWYDGSLDTLPSPFAGPLAARWNDWLASRYASDASLLAAWKAIHQDLGANLLRNGAFNSGVANWTLERHETAAATVARTTDFNGASAARITVTRASSASWHVQFNQPNLRLTAGQPYTLTFSAKADVAGRLDFSVMMAHDPWQTLGLSESASLSTQWQTFTRTFVPTASDTNARVNFGGLGNRLVTVWLADVRLQPGGDIGQLPAGSSLATRNVPPIRFGADGFRGTTEARLDWLRFAIDLENRYYDAMVGHLRTNIGYRGLIFGTIMANSPLAVQTRLEVIDSHAYWQHPVFPGTAWDPANWHISNLSILNTPPAESTLASLARQRVRGKPFMVTEYQHPSPNSYGAEGPLVLAAYAALQDWDGIWLFDYGWGNDAAHGSETRPMGRFRSYFDTAQHPTKMANLRVAANLFRRGDLRPARDEIVLAVTPERELDLLSKRASAWSVFHSGQLDLSGGHAFVNRVSVSYGSGASGLPAAPPAPATTTSDTGELQWLTSATAGVLRIEAPRTRGVIGFITNRTFTLGDVTIRGLTNQLGWASVMLTLEDGSTFTGGGRALLVVAGRCENTGQQWNTTEQRSLSNWGSAPTLIETVPVEVTLPLPANRVRAWRLDERGQRQQTVGVRLGTEGRAVLATQSTDATLWYEIELAPPSASSFETWRTLQFNPEELSQPNISGPEAVPAGDGVPNRLKYVFGLDARQPAQPTDLPQWGVSVASSQRTLWMSFPRRKGANDFALRPYYSLGWPAWVESPVTVSRVVGEVETLRTELGIPREATSSGLLKLELSWSAP